MSVDIETEVWQLWAGIRVISSAIKSRLPEGQHSLTFSTSGQRSGRQHELAGLAQILQLSEAFALELAIKALLREIFPDNNPPKTHDLLGLFEQLPKAVKNRLHARWNDIDGRSPLAQQLAFDAFLGEYRLLFEGARYLYEKRGPKTFNSMDFEIAMLVVMYEISGKRLEGTTLSDLLSIANAGRNY